VKYCIDTSSLLAANRSYPRVVFPTVWENLSQLVKEERLVSSEEVLRELKRKEGDVVYQWAAEHKIMFHPLSTDIQTLVTQIMAQFQELVDARSGKSFADPFVVATAKIHQCVVVTEEAATGSPARPKIPDVCKSFGMTCIRLVELIRREGWTFR
jgi:hypothetical protein